MSEEGIETDFGLPSIKKLVKIPDDDVYNNSLPRKIYSINLNPNWSYLMDDIYLQGQR